jgi:hypothetical protein
VHGECVRDEPSHEDKRQDYPMAAEGVEEHVASRNSREERRIKPEEHAHAIRRPEIIFDPLHEAAVEQRLVKNVHNV